MTHPAIDIMEARRRAECKATLYAIVASAATMGVALTAPVIATIAIAAGATGLTIGLALGIRIMRAEWRREQ